MRKVLGGLVALALVAGGISPAAADTGSSDVTDNAISSAFHGWDKKANGPAANLFTGLIEATPCSQLRNDPNNRKYDTKAELIQAILDGTADTPTTSISESDWNKFKYELAIASGNRAAECGIVSDSSVSDLKLASSQNGRKALSASVPGGQTTLIIAVVALLAGAAFVATHPNLPLPAMPALPTMPH